MYPQFLKSIVSPISAASLPKRLLFLDLETRGGLKDFGKIEMLVGGAIEYQRTGKCQVERGKFEHWEIDKIDALKERLFDFDGLIVGMNLYGYDYRVLRRYFDVAPLIAKTLDFQHTLWRIGKGAVGMASLAQHNTRRKKVPGKDMATFWDDGDKSYVLKRNRVDCELTAELYFKFLETGRLSAHRGSFMVREDDCENILIASGVMSQYTAEEYAWRLEHHNGVRGDGRFLGLPWIAHDAYNENRPALFFCAKCWECECHTLVATPNDRTVNTWLATLSCGNCSNRYAPPIKGKRTRYSDSEYKALLEESSHYEKLWRNDSHARFRETTPQRSYSSGDSGGSFEIISEGLHWGTTPFDVQGRRWYETLEHDLRRELRRQARPNTTYAAYWKQWHPDLTYWKGKRALHEPAPVDDLNSA